VADGATSTNSSEFESTKGTNQTTDEDDLTPPQTPFSDPF